MERTIERTSILLASNPASKQAASAIYYENGDFDIRWFANIHRACVQLVSQVGLDPDNQPTVVQLPSAQV